MSGSWKRVALVSLAAPLLACATGRGQGSGVQRDSNVITLAEIEATVAETAFQIVQQLRPRWMIRNRGQRSFAVSAADYARVIVDDMPPREFDFLREIRRENITEIRYLSPSEATLLYGSGYNEGVIKVKTRQ
jgi:hypothetical protein